MDPAHRRPRSVPGPPSIKDGGELLRPFPDQSLPDPVRIPHLAAPIRSLPHCLAPWPLQPQRHQPPSRPDGPDTSHLYFSCNSRFT